MPTNQIPLDLDILVLISSHLGVKEGYHGRRQAVCVCQGGCYAGVFPIGGNIDGNDLLDFGSKIQKSSALSKNLGIAFLALRKGDGNKNIFPAFWEQEQVFWSKDTAIKCSWRKLCQQQFSFEVILLVSLGNNEMKLDLCKLGEFCNKRTF